MAEGTITKRGESLLRPLAPVGPPPDTKFFDAGGPTDPRAMHTHRCPSTPNHDWLCNSPYCASLNELCPDHGGLEPIHIGREPWKR
jgi:hypothetical protein